MTDIQLGGCFPESLMMNLKALGIFRILAEQSDPEITANWERGIFVLHTKLNSDELENFFLNQYKPTPLVSPWNGGSGFFDVNDSVVDKIEQSGNERLREYSEVFKDVREILKEHVSEYTTLVNKKDKKSMQELKNKIKDNKNFLLTQFRNKITEKLLPWFDAMFVTASDKPSLSTILGSAGNDGNFEISENFMKCVCECILSDKNSKDKKCVNGWIKGSLFGDPVKLLDNSSAYFFPDGYKGPNCTSIGFEEKTSLMNPWDYILMIEGTLLFAGSVSRRSLSKKAAFPFTVNESMAGYGSSSSEKSRGEVWIPLWDNPATYDEIKYIFNEGRSQIGKKHANTGADFARALASLGIERGIYGFQRFGMLERKGQAFLANNLGSINTMENHQVNLLTDIDEWLDKIRKEKNLPMTIESLLRSIDGAIINFCTQSKKQYLQEILIILGKIEWAISNSSSIRNNIEPLQKLSFDWLNACYDKTPEFRLAVSLASILDKDGQYPIRCNLERIEYKSRKAKWRPSSPHAVWNKNNTIQNMIAILERRCIDAQIHKSKTIPLESKIPAPVNDILLFLNDQLDYEKIGNLLLPFSMINYDNHLDYENDREIWKIPEFMPEIYISIKTNFPPVSFDNNITKFEPSIVGLLKSGKTNLAHKISQRRLYITGTTTLTYNVSKYSSDQVQEIPEQMASKLAAAVLFPLNQSDMKEMIRFVTKPNTV